MTVSEFSRLASITPSGERTCQALEDAISEAVSEAIEGGLCYGMITSVLHHAVWQLHYQMEND